MLSDLWDRFVSSPFAAFLLILGLAVIAAQLSIMANIAQGQVQRAQLRDALKSSGNQAMARCIESANNARQMDACSSTVTLALGR